MRMSSLKDSIAPLESDLKAVPPRISVYHDLPFAIMRYNPTDEWELRWEIKLLATRLEAVGKDGSRSCGASRVGWVVKSAGLPFRRSAQGVTAQVPNLGFCFERVFPATFRR